MQQQQSCFLDNGDNRLKIICINYNNHYLINHQNNNEQKKKENNFVFLENVQQIKNFSLKSKYKRKTTNFF